MKRVLQFIWTWFAGHEEERDQRQHMKFALNNLPDVRPARDAERTAPMDKTCCRTP